MVEGLAEEDRLVLRLPDDCLELFRFVFLDLVVFLVVDFFFRDAAILDISLLKNIIAHMVYAKKVNQSE